MGRDAIILPHLRTGIRMENWTGRQFAIPVASIQPIKGDALDDISPEEKPAGYGIMGEAFPAPVAAMLKWRQPRIARGGGYTS